ncbi:MAG: hypothetical protein HC770_13245 [Pseudanabaena sp. CRU_2_10]|nr:hypothetical protein [Pseudanabaena sp. CRU_2_10]
MTKGSKHCLKPFSSVELALKFVGWLERSHTIAFLSQVEIVSEIES